jgi:hypothetical protein
VLAAVRRVLRTPGIFVFDVILGCLNDGPIVAKHEMRTVDGRCVRQESVFGRDSVTTSISVGADYLPQASCERHVQYYWPRGALEMLAKLHGFRFGELTDLPVSRNLPIAKVAVILHLD